MIPWSVLARRRLDLSYATFCLRRNLFRIAQALAVIVRALAGCRIQSGYEAMMECRTCSIAGRA